MSHNEREHSATVREDQKVLNSLGLHYVVPIVDELWVTESVDVCQIVHHDDYGPGGIYGPNSSENPEAW